MIYTAKLTLWDPKGAKIQSIKCVRLFTTLGLKEAKDFVETYNGVPVPVMLTAEQVVAITYGTYSGANEPDDGDEWQQVERHIATYVGLAEVKALYSSEFIDLSKHAHPEVCAQEST